jgi:radical SAM superfamily enzyme YgiQ (UPF0313 family)
MTTRGCPYRCAYCPAGGTKLRRRSPKLVADEIERAQSLGINDILFFDEIFALDHKRVKELCDEFKRRRLTARWNVRTRITDITPEIAGIMRSAGCNLIQFGIESGTDRIQRLMKKNLNLGEALDKMRIVQDAGILTYGNFMIGSPTETEEEMNETIEYAIQLKLDFAVFGITNLLPKTQYYERAVSEGKVTKDFWREYIVNPLVPIENVYWPDFDKKRLEEINRSAYVRFYLRPGYVVNYLRRIVTPWNLGGHLKAAFRVLGSFVKGLKRSS